MNHLQLIKTLWPLAALCTTLGCAGPTTPFGTPNLFTEKGVPGTFSGDTAATQSVKIKFFPQRQVLHGKVDFKIIIEDPVGIGPDYRIRLFYNKLDVSEKFLWQAKRVFINQEHTKLQLTVPNLRIQPLKTNHVYFGYMRNINTKPIFAIYTPPSCSVFSAGTLASSHEIGMPFGVKTMIQAMGEEEKINPNFIAGLVAQESGFDTKAVSWAKAIGLTQITPLGEAEVIKTYKGWPRYPDINQMSLPLIRMRVMRGKINSKNEWRLNPEYSIRGGTAYVKFLNNYWHKQENFQKLINTSNDPERALSSAILASYNSGPARVNYALQRFGNGWLQDAPELGEARLYVARVTSYCDYFSQEEGP